MSTTSQTPRLSNATINGTTQNQTTTNGQSITNSNSNTCTTPPPVIFLLVTLLMTICATTMMCIAVMTDHWETITWDREFLLRLNNGTTHTLHWHLNDRIARLPIKRK